MEIQQKISRELNEQKIGQTLKVIVDRKEENYFVGRSEFDSPEVDPEVLITGPEELGIGDFCEVKITDAEDYDLYGEVV
jgi:ribosomal protein S12 methylthiotransferase